VGTFFAPFDYPTVGACFHGWKDLLNGTPRLRSSHDLTNPADPGAQFHSYTLGGREVKLICGAWTHTWPGGGSPIGGEPGAGGGIQTTTNLNTSRAIWEFFREKRLTAAA
jgi:hypothetical protein